MIERGTIWKVVLVVAVIVVLIAGGNALYQLGYSAGAADFIEGGHMMRFTLRDGPGLHLPGVSLLRSTLDAPFTFGRGVFGLGWSLVPFGLLLLLAASVGAWIGARMGRGPNLTGPASGRSRSSPERETN